MHTADFHLRSVYPRNHGVGQSWCFPRALSSLQQKWGAGNLQRRTPGFGNLRKCHFPEELLRIQNTFHNLQKASFPKQWRAVDPTLALGSLQLQWVYVCSCMQMQVREFRVSHGVLKGTQSSLQTTVYPTPTKKTSLQKHFAHWNLNWGHLTRTGIWMIPGGIKASAATETSNPNPTLCQFSSLSSRIEYMQSLKHRSSEGEKDNFSALCYFWLWPASLH